MGFGSSLRRATTNSTNNPITPNIQVTESSIRKPNYSGDIDLSTDPSYMTSLNYQYEHDKTKQNIKPLVPLSDRVNTSDRLFNFVSTLSASLQLLLLAVGLYIIKKMIDNISKKKRPKIYNMQYY